MRCPTCGTENVPDSRFCGACGAKLTPAESRVAPTAKIPDDAPFPAHYGSQAPYTPPPHYPASIPYQTGPASIPPRPATAPQNGPASIPPQNYQSGPASIPPRPASIPPLNGPASIPPGAYQAPGSIPPNTYQAPGSIPPTNAAMYGRAQSVARDPREPAESSMPIVARPRWGLIILVLLLDAGLATAGAIMLQKGLAKPEATEAPAPAVAPGSAAPPKAAVQPGPSPTVAANIAAIAEKVPDPVSKDDDNKGSAAKAATTKKPPATKPGPTPQDPYANDKGLRAEIELAAARSGDEFNRCRDDAGEVHGRVDVGYTVEPDGRVDRVKISSNTTGSQTLASCLQVAISHWAFATRPSQASDFVRPFIY